MEKCENKEKETIKTEDIIENITASEDLKTEEDIKIEELEKEIENKNAQFLRLAAEYDNFRKRTEKDKALIYKSASAEVISSILPIADSLERALDSLKDVPEEYKKGIIMITSQFFAALENTGAKAFGAPGEIFNPDLHNAILHIEDEKLPENSIVEVFQKGYMLEGKVLRHAMVKVAN